MYITSIDELKGINTMLRDEHSALQLAFTSLEDKYRKFQVQFYFLCKILNFRFFFVFNQRHVFLINNRGQRVLWEKQTK